MAGQFVAGLGRRLTPTGHDRNRTPTENPVPAPRKTVRLTHPLQPGCCAGRPQAQVDGRRSDFASVLLRHPAPPRVILRRLNPCLLYRPWCSAPATPTPT